MISKTPPRRGFFEPAFSQRFAIIKPHMLKNVFLFYGENTFGLQQEIKRWQEEFEKKYGDLNIEIIENEETAERITASLESSPFLSEKRLIIVKNFMENADAKEQEKLGKRLEKIADTTVAVFYEEKGPDKRTSLYRKFKENTQLKEFTLPTPLQIDQFLKTQVIKRNLRIQPKEIKFLLDRVGPDLWTLDNEIQKLSSYCKNRAATEQDIEALCKENISTSVFKMTDALSEKNAKRAIELLHILAENGEETLMIFAMIVRHFRMLLLLSDLKKNATPERDLFNEMKKYDAKMHPYAVQIATRQAKNFTHEALKNAYDTLADLDIKFKNGDIQETEGDRNQSMMALERFILNHSR